MNRPADVTDSVSPLFSSLNASAASLTLCEFRQGERVVGAAVDSVTAYFVLAGTLHLRQAGEANLAVRAGSLAFLPAGIEQDLSSTIESVGPKSAADHLTRRRGWALLDLTHGGFADLAVVAMRLRGTAGRSLDRAAVVSLTDHPIGRQLVSLLREEVARTVNGPALGAALFDTCIAMALRQVVEEEDRSAGAAPDHRDLLLARVTEAITTHPNETHTVASLAATAGMSRASFVRHFMRVTGYSPMEFVWRTRLEEAATLLRGTTLPIKQVAARAGFTSRSHFSRVFREKYGSDPSQFRLQDERAMID